MTPVSRGMQKAHVYMGLAYLAFVICSSLVPLNFHYRSWDNAWQAFDYIIYPHSKVDSHTDWIANILLFIPLTFLWSGIFWQSTRTSVKVLTAFAVLMGATAISIAIAFTRFVFSPHTASVNSLLAGTIGSAMGVVLWLLIGRRITDQFARLRRRENTAPLASTTATPLTKRPNVTAGPKAALLPPDEAGRGRIMLLSGLCLGILVWAVLRYPLGSYWLGAGLLIYLAILRVRPQAALIIVPAALPVLDLAPFTGRFFFDEFDCLLLATMVAAAWWWPVNKTSYRLVPAARFLFTLFTLSTISALMIGAYPFPALDINSFNNYYSPYNALRVGKGLLWALLLLPFLRSQLDRNAATAHRLFALGMTLGVFATGVIVLWERIAFTGLFNFSNGYRVVAMFSGMHTGGAYIEGYLITAIPFVAWWTIMSQRWIGRLFGAGVFVLGSYAVMVSYARGGYIALAIGMTILLIGLLLHKMPFFTASRAVAALVLLLLLAGVAWPVLHGPYMQGRFSATQRDMDMRQAHWKDALRMMEDGIAAKLFGMGLGRYPDTYFWRNSEGIQPATYSFKKEHGNTYLELGSGDAVYIEQLVDVRPNRHYRLSFSARAQTDSAELDLPICEKWMLYSANCIWPTIPIGDTSGQWRRFTLEFDTRNFGQRPWYAYRPLKLSLSNPTSGSALAIDDVSIKSDDGKELLRNGNFNAGMDHWFFSTDNYQPWHFENLWLQLYFEQGALGLFMFGALVAGTFIVLITRYREKELPLPALAGALAGFLTLGAIDSLFDFPRMGLLFYMLVAWAMLQARSKRD